jgi:proteasome lid subunit RPN8/RPN11
MGLVTTKPPGLTADTADEYFGERHGDADENAHQESSVKATSTTANVSSSTAVVGSAAAALHAVRVALSAYDMSRFYANDPAYALYTRRRAQARHGGGSISARALAETPKAFGALTLVQCKQFGSERDDLVQPFAVEIEWSALVVTEFHAHLSKNEVIGFVAGRFDAPRNVLRVVRACPCVEAKHAHEHDDVVEDAAINVEMDAISALQVRDDIEKSGLQVVGWFHSHPTFQPDPSLRDIETQTRFQELFRAGAREPFVGLIITTFDADIPSTTSIVNCFITNTTNLTVAEQAGLVIEVWCNARCFEAEVRCFVQRREQRKRSTKPHVPLVCVQMDERF